MENNVLEYKGYHTKVVYSAEDNMLYGIIEGITDFVDFECHNLNDVEKEFHNAVDDYLTFCHENGFQPEKEYKGQFNVRISPQLHKELAFLALRSEDSINGLVQKAIELFVKANSPHLSEDGNLEAKLQPYYLSEDSIVKKYKK